MDLCDRTPGTCDRGEHWSAARIRTTAIKTCIPPSLHWCHQVRRGADPGPQVLARSCPAPGGRAELELLGLRCSTAPGLFAPPPVKRTAAPRGLLEFPASGRMRDIWPSAAAAAQHTVHACALFLSGASITLADGCYRQRTVDSVICGWAELDIPDLSEPLQQKLASE